MSVEFEKGFILGQVFGMFIGFASVLFGQWYVNRRRTSTKAAEATKANVIDSGS